MKKLLTLAIAAVALFATSCQKDADAEVSIEASFTTDKDVYEMGDYVVITNTSKATGANIAVYKWNIAGETSYDETPENIRFSSEGEYTISLEVTSDVKSIKSTFEKTISVQNNTVPPVADFSYSPELVVAGEPVQFTDLSSDEDGEIEAWEWKFGTSTSTEQNPEYTFGQSGDIEVSLTVTDNNLAKTTKKITITVESGAHDISLNWAQPYETKDGAYVQFTSPALSPDGKQIYVTSSGYNLACYNTDGSQKWVCKVGSNPSAVSNKDDLKGPTPTPSVDTDGTIYVAAGFKEKNTEGGQSVVASFYDYGSSKWSVELGGNASLRYFAPVITPDYIMFSDRAGAGKHFHVLSKASGSEVYDGHCNAGSYGGVIALKNGIAIAGTAGTHGSRVFFESAKYPEIESNNLYAGLAQTQTAGSAFYFSCATDGQSLDRGHNYGCVSQADIDAGNLLTGTLNSCEYPGGSAMAADADQKVYIIFSNQGFWGTKDGEGNAIVYCYDTKKTKFGEYPVPEWRCVVKGGADQSGVGVVVGEDGTVFAASHVHDGNGWGAFVTAISSEGSVKWEHRVEGNIKSSVAVDDAGCIFYNDLSLGKIVKLSPAGEKLSELALGEDLYSSPTIAEDGTIYVTGMKEGKPTLFSLSAVSTNGYADSWSQLGGSPQKTFYKY